MILILGGPDDRDAEGIYAELDRRGADVARFDSERFSGVGAVSLALASAGRLDGVTSASGREVHLEDVRAVWLGGRNLAEDSVLYDLWGMLSAPTIPASPSTAQRATNLAQQQKNANQLGFAVSSAMRRSFSDVRSRAEQASLNYMTEVAVVVVSDKVFAAELNPSMHGSHVVLRPRAPYVLPPAESQRCSDLVNGFGLEYAVLHFGVTYQNDLIFLGLDPRGEYWDVEHMTDMPITRSIAELLMVRAGRHANFLNAESLMDAGHWSLAATIQAHPSYSGLKTVR